MRARNHLLDALDTRQASVSQDSLYATLPLTLAVAHSRPRASTCTLQLQV